MIFGHFQSKFQALQSRVIFKKNTSKRVGGSNAAQREAESRRSSQLLSREGAATEREGGGRGTDGGQTGVEELVQMSHKRRSDLTSSKRLNRVTRVSPNVPERRLIGKRQRVLIVRPGFSR